MKERERNLDVIKWLIVIILFIIAIVSNHIYRYFNFFIRILIIVPIITVAGSIAIITDKGRSTLLFAKKASTELNKIMWPTYRETLNTTLIVVAMTTLMSLILWGLDSLLIHVISFITNLRF